jgi:CIC family chloride channel protein
MRDRLSPKRIGIARIVDAVRSDETTIGLVVAVLVGVIAGLGAVAFRWLIRTIGDFFFGTGGDLLGFMGDYYVILLPAIGGLFVGLIVYYGAREARGHGVPEVMEAVVAKGGRIRPRVAAVKSLASALCIGSGGSVGREGPIVQIGASFGSSMG